MGKQIIKSAFFIMIITLISRMMGLVRTIFIGQEFGTSLEASAYMLAFLIPNTIFLFLPGAINAAFIPPLKGFLAKGKTVEAQTLFQKMATVTTVIHLLAAGLLWLFAHPIIGLIAGNASLELQVLAAELLRIMIPSVVFIAFISLFSSTLNTHYYFVLPMFGPILNSGFVILSMYLFVPSYGIYGLAIGTTGGYAASALLMLPFILKEQYRFTPNWQWQDPELLKIGENMIPILFASVLSSLNEFIEKFLISDFGDDKIAAFGYARQVFQLPLAIFLGSIAIPLFVLLLDQLKKADWKAAKGTIEKALLSMMMLLVPVSIGFWLLGEQLIVVLLQRGSFDPTSTKVTSLALVLLGIALFPLAGRDIFTRTFYALENTKTPVIIGALQMVIYIGAALLLIPVMGFSGVALGFAIGASTGAFFLGFLLWRQIGAFLTKEALYTTMKIVVASTIMGIFIQMFTHWGNGWNLPVFLVTAILLGGAIYGSVLILLKESLLLELLQQVKRNFSS